MGRKRDVRRTTGQLRIIAQDPGLRDRDGNIVTTLVDVPAEQIRPGPTGYRVKIIDYDVSTDTLYKEADIGSGIDQSYPDLYKDASNDTLLGDPRFHAQNAYAIIMRTLARFEQALGRRVRWGCDGHQLHVAPHAFAQANAFYSRQDRGLFLGYFTSPTGKTIFTCLSHDVIAHETTHAILDGLRRRFLEPSSPDQAAFHEGFADVVAMLSIFSLRDVVEGLLDIATQGEDLIDPAFLTAEALKDSTLLGLAEEMGGALAGVRGQALRRSIKLDPKWENADSPEFEEEHRRGELIVAAMLNAFLEIWVKRIEKIGTIEIKTVAADGSETVSRKKDRDLVAESGAKVASHLLTMAIRAIDYCPPVDLSFSDFLSALLTVDREVTPDDDRYGYRDVLLYWFNKFRIRKSHGSGRDGTWKRCEAELTYARTHFESLLRDEGEVFRFLWENKEKLSIDERGYMEVQSVQPCTRIGPDGFSLRETVAEYIQILTLTAKELADMGLQMPEDIEPDKVVRIYGGGALIFDEYGQLKYQIAKHLVEDKYDLERQSKRIQYLWDNGRLDQIEDGTSRLAALHLARAGVLGALS
ncbi:MAG TPA: hypothetical protein VIT45_17195 [Allosphingosinicella sp.]